MRTDYYQQEYCRKILDREERRAKLRADYYSPEIVEISYKLKTLRSKLRSAKASNREALRDEILVLKDQLDERKQEEVSSMIALIRKGNVHIKVKIQNINNRNTYILLDRDSMIISQIIKYELKKSYTLLPANRNIIIEQLRGLLDNPMPKIIIRADVQHFFETIPQQPLLSKIKDDGFISRLTFKYLTKFFLCCNEANNNTSKVGVPRGLPFSSYLAELYMRPIDDEISQMKGVYYYKRYVDDMIIIADPCVWRSDGCWARLKKLFQGRKLKLHEDSQKKFLSLFDGDTDMAFDYLGYTFEYSKGKLSLKMTQKRFNKYLTMIDAVFSIYSQCANYRKGKYQSNGERNLRKDALSQLLERVKMLTSNGLLSGRENYVATGVYYSNKFLTSTEQLAALDDYLYRTINDKERFNPPNTLFNYDANNNYSTNIELIKRKLCGFSFVEGYKNRKWYKNAHSRRVLLDLQNIYRSRISNNEK